ncbi:MAG: Na+/H+ antiporter [Chloroflexota bacterium]
MEEFLQAETIVIELLLVVAIVAMAVRRFRIPYTVALVVVGLIITTSQPIGLEMTPELILALFLPPLVFQAAFHINLSELRHDLVGILLLAVPGVILTTSIVGGLVSVTTSLSLPLALVFGALIAATDPVAVVAVFRSLGVPSRLSLLLEGESLLNDGTAIVIFNLMLVSALTDRLDLAAGVLDFARVAAGGILIGVFFGWLVSQVIARVDDYLIETTLTTVLAFGTYLLAERLQVSGVLAVVAAGLINGNIGPSGMSPTTRIVLFNFWEYVAFLANSLVFLLIGLRVNVRALVEAWQPIFWAVVAVLVGRVVVVYGLGLLANRFSEPIPFRWQHVLAWSGLRGAVSLALALSLPLALGPDREVLQVMAFGVVLFTLLVQGTTIQPLLGWLRVGVSRGADSLRFEELHARLAALREGERHLNTMHRQGLLSSYTWEDMSSTMRDDENSLTKQVNDLMEASPHLAEEEREAARKELLRAQRGALMANRRDGLISAEVFEKLTVEVDEALEGKDYRLSREKASESEAAG